MRWLGTIISAAILIILVYLVVGWIVDGYFDGDIVPDGAVPDSWAAPDSWSEWRDIFLVMAGLAWFLAGLAAMLFLVALALLVFAARRLIRENAAPAIDSLRETIDNARGTTEFVGETVASPIIRVYSVFSGVRNGLRAVTGLSGRVRGRRKGRRR